jgi:acrylyl-CoA reductase (NADPH)
LRKTAWKRLAKELPDSLLQRVYKIISLAEVPAFSAKLLAGQVNGRLVVDLEL